MKLPLQVVLPFGSMIVGGAIAISIGLTNLALADRFSHTEPVIFAAFLMIAVMAIAGYLSAKYPNPEPEDDSSDH